jgi:hypothetical protein
VLATDKLADDTRLSDEQIAQRTGQSTRAVRALRRARGIRAERVGQGNVGRPDYPIVMQRADALFEQGIGRKAAFKILQREFPESTWLTLGVLDAREKKHRKAAAAAAA